MPYFQPSSYLHSRPSLCSFSLFWSRVGSEPGASIQLVLWPSLSVSKACSSSGVLHCSWLLARDPRVWLHPVRALSPAQPMLPRQLYVTGFLSVPPTVSKAYPVSFFCLSFSFSPCHSPRRGALFPPGCAANARPHGCLQQVGPTQAKSDLGWLGRVFISCLFNEYEKSCANGAATLAWFCFECLNFMHPICVFC